MKSLRSPVLVKGTISIIGFLVAALLFHVEAAHRTSDSAPPQHDWTVYGGSDENDHYSSLSQINRQNVKQLQIAWSVDTEEKGGLETSPLVVDGVLYGITPSQKVLAVDAASGKVIWKFDSGINGTQPDRGLAYWADGADKRIIVGIMNLVGALNANTGEPIRTFGQEGHIDLRDGLGRGPGGGQAIALTSPPLIFKDLFIVGGRNPETLPAPPGDIRAFDVRTGKLRWTFHTIPHPGEPGYDTWPPDAWKTSGAANNWAGMTVDVKRGLVFVPTGSTAADFYGADRIGDDLFSDCLIALDAETGKLRWYFQGVRHDIWDRDFDAPPVLFTLRRDGKLIDAVAQTSKQGFVFVFDRVTGDPLYPIDYKEAPASDVPGEVAARTQGLPRKPAPFTRQILTEDLLTNRNPQVHEWALKQFRTFRSAGQFVPFSVGKDTVMFPGFDGGAEWGGPAVDPQTNIIYINANDIASTGTLAETLQAKDANSLYLNQCSACHGEDRTGSPPTMPSLVGLASQTSVAPIMNTIHDGKGRMPAFPSITEEQAYWLARFLMTGVNRKLASDGPELIAMKYHLTGEKRFVDPDGYPAVAPPWGTLNAIDLNLGEYIWKIPLGEYPELAAQGMKNTGTENYGGPIVTAGGLVFIGATSFDKKFRAFDKSTGELLWETTLPFPANSTPITYMVNGRQFIAVAAGGGKDPKSPSGGVYIAFALPVASSSKHYRTELSTRQIIAAAFRFFSL